MNSFTSIGSKKASVHRDFVDRATRCIVAWAVCAERTPELTQSVVDPAPHAASYYSDALNTYRELCW